MRRDDRNESHTDALPDDLLVIGHIADEVQAAVRRGEEVDVDAITAKHPELESEIRQLVPFLADLEALGGGSAGDGAREAPLTERRLGDFRIAREIGRGGMGIVYEAEQVSLGRRVALKVLPFAAVLDERQVARFRNEAQAAAQLHHPHIVPVYSVGLEQGVHYYSMQYVEGQSLAQVLHDLREEAAGKLGVNDRTASATTSELAESKGLQYARTVARIGLEVARALEYAHARGIVHRDIKPANVLLDRSGSTWVTDFGLARASVDSSVTLSGDILGTLRYMSPEQASGRNDRVDGRTDVYSLGATLYELLTLRPVAEGDDRALVLRQVLEEEPRAPRRLRPSIPRELETIVLTCLAKDSSGRYAGARELAADLERFLEDKPVQARRPGPLKHAAKWVRRHRALSVSLIIAIVALIVAGALGYRMRRDRIEGEYERIVTTATPIVDRAFWSRWRQYRGLGRPERSSSSETERQHRRLENAREDLEDAVHRLPARPEAPYQLARCLDLLGAPEAALAVLLRRSGDFVPALTLRNRLSKRLGLAPVPMELDPNDAWSRAWVNVEKALDERDWEGAVKGYDVLVDLAGGKELTGFEASLRLGRGVAHLERGERDHALLALLDFHYVLERSSDQLVPALFFAEACLRAGADWLAEPALNKVLSRASTEQDEIAEEVAFLYGKEDHDDAYDWVEIIRDARRRDVARILLLLGDWNFEQAEKVALEALRRDESDALIHALLANIYDALPGDRTRVRAHVQRAVKEGPRDPEVLYVAGRAARWESSLLRRSVELAPDRLDVKSFLAGRTGNLLEARKLADEVLRVAPDYFEALQARGVAAMRLGDWDDAELDLKRCLEIRPAGYASPRVYLAALYVHTGRHDEARKTYREALKVFPEDGIANRRYAQFLQRRGEDPDAVLFRYCRGGLRRFSGPVPPVWDQFLDLLRWPPDGLKNLEPLEEFLPAIDSFLVETRSEPRFFETAALVRLRSPRSHDLRRALQHVEKALSLGGHRPEYRPDFLATLAEVLATSEDDDSVARAVLLLEEAVCLPEAREGHVRALERWRSIEPDRLGTPREVDREVALLASLDPLVASQRTSGLRERIAGPEPEALGAYLAAAIEFRFGSSDSIPGILREALASAQLLAPFLLERWWETVGEAARAGEPLLPDTPGSEDLQWVAGRLHEGKPLRIDCGAPDGYDDSRGFEWSHDRFFRSGIFLKAGETPVQNANGRAFCRTGRAFQEDALFPGYRVPVWNGTYRVTVYPAFLHEVEPGDHLGRFRIVLEDRNVGKCDPSRYGPSVEMLEFETAVEDAFLDLRLESERGGQQRWPCIVGLEIERLR